MVNEATQGSPPHHSSMNRRAGTRESTGLRQELHGANRPMCQRLYNAYAQIIRVMGRWRMSILLCLTTHSSSAYMTYTWHAYTRITIRKRGSLNWKNEALSSVDVLHLTAFCRFCLMRMSRDWLCASANVIFYLLIYAHVQCHARFTTSRLFRKPQQKQGIRLDETPTKQSRNS